MQNILSQPEETAPVLIVGLGNIGAKYARTRHNAGFVALEQWRAQWNLPVLRAQAKLHAHITRGTIMCANQKQSIILATPNTMMNRSGAAVSALMQYYQIPQNNIIIVHDDADLAIGRYKTTSSSRAGGHNGVSDIITALGSQDFTRIRIGVRPTLPNTTENTPHLRALDFVLHDFTADEQIKLDAVIKEIAQTIFQ